MHVFGFEQHQNNKRPKIWNLQLYTILPLDLNSNFVKRLIKAWGDPDCLHYALLMHFIHSLFTKLCYYCISCPAVVQRKKEKGTGFSPTRTVGYCCCTTLPSLVFELLKTDGQRDRENISFECHAPDSTARNISRS